MSTLNDRLVSAALDVNFGEIITGVGAWVQNAQIQVPEPVESLVNDVPVIIPSENDELETHSIAASDPSGPWARWVVVAPVQNLDGARVTVTPVAMSDQAAIQVSPDATSRATTALNDDRSEWISIATAAEALGQELF